MPPLTPLPQTISHELGYPLAFTESGRGDSMLLIHGSLCDYRYWRWQIPAFSERLNVMAPSLRGYWPHAFRTRNPQFTIGQHAEDLIRFVQARKRPVHVLGHSRGARVALELTCRAPDLVRSLTLADPGFRLAGAPGLREFLVDVVDLIESGDTEGALSLFVDTVNGTGTWRQMVGWFKTMVRQNAGTLLSQINEIDEGFDLGRAGLIRCPVLLLNGAQSPPHYGRVLDALEQNLAQSERTTITDAAHGMNLANPKAFNARVLQFVTAYLAGSVPETP